MSDASLRPGDRIRWHGRVAEVLDVSDTGRYATIRCTATNGRGRSFTAHVNVEGVRSITTDETGGTDGGVRSNH